MGAKAKEMRGGEGRQAFGRDSWLPLVDRIAANAGAAFRLKAGLDVEPMKSAYSAAGFGASVAQAIDSAVAVTRPTLVSRKQFEAQVQVAGDRLLSLARTRWSRGVICLAMEPRPKSNMWVAALVLNAVRGMCRGDREWRAVSQRVHFVLVDRYIDSARLPRSQGPVNVFLTDDCSYTGMQMMELCRVMLSTPGVAEVIAAPLFATAKSLSTMAAVKQSRPCGFAVECGSVVRGIDSYMLFDLYETDVAICMRAKGQKRWMFSTLYTCMGLLNYSLVEECPSDTRFGIWNVVHSGGFGFGRRKKKEKASTEKKGKKMWVARSVGTTATVFSHKVADGVSVPTEWFVSGATAALFAQRLCMGTTCDPASLEVRHVKLQALFTALDEFDEEVSSVSLFLKPFVEVVTGLNVAEEAVDLAIAEAEKLNRVMMDAPPPPRMAATPRRGRTQSPGQSAAIDLGRMPLFAPLISSAACGKKLAESHARAQAGDWAAMMRADRHSAECSSKPLYIAQMEAALEEMLAAGEGSDLASRLLGSE